MSLHNLLMFILQENNNYPSIISDVNVASYIDNSNVRYCMEEGTFKDHHASTALKARIRSIFIGMLDFAVEYELIDRNYAKDVNIHDKKVEHRPHMSFSEDELALLWDSLDVPYVDVLLIQCYTGMRPQELGLIEISNVDLDTGFIVGGIKTDAGKNRVIPIAWNPVRSPIPLR